MTAIAFHFNAADKQAYACRLLRKAYLKGARLQLLVPDGQVDALDQALWLMAPGEFVPHSKAGDPAEVCRHSPIHIDSRIPEGGAAAVLVNLQAGVPPGYERFERVIEIVGQDDADRQQARQRWRQYVAAGIEPERHDLQTAPNG